MVLVCYKISLDQIIEASYGFIGRSSSKVSCRPPKLGGNRHFGSGDIMLLVCYLISQDHVIKMSYSFMWMGLLKVNHQSATFGSQRHCGSGDIMLLFCHMLHVIKSSCAFIGKNTSR